MQFNLSSYIRILKTNSKSASISDESFVSELFDPFVVALGLKNKFGKGESSKTFAEGFLSSSLLFCVGSMAVMGSMEAGINGD